MEVLRIGVCKGRHPIPVDLHVYPRFVDPLNVEYLRYTAKKFFKENACKLVDLELYVSGLTVAVLAIIMEAQKCENIRGITVMHYDCSKDEYYPQIFRD